MKRLLYILILSFGAASCAAQSVPGYFAPIASPYDYQWLRARYLRLPTSTTGAEAGAIRYNASDSSVYYYTGTQWVKSGADLTNYYTKTNLQTTGQAQVHWGNVTNVPAFLSTAPSLSQVLGYGSTLTGTTTVIQNSNPLTFQANFNTYLTIDPNYVEMMAKAGSTRYAYSGVNVSGVNTTYQATARNGSDWLTFQIWAEGKTFSFSGGQLQIEKYTPTSVSDATYPNGTLCTDENYLYFKSAGAWKKIAWADF
jgi:hypothetical protein